MNRLKIETSPYLLQHAHHPVDWYPWGPAAFRKAKEEDKVILLSIGYSACHWCHVMAHESFEDEEVAGYMNEHFINIKVDREEHPDIDAIYMEAVQSLTGRGGWPLNVFLTPGLKPFYGATYFPPERKGGLPSWREVLMHIINLYTKNRDRVYEISDQLTEAMKKGQGVALPEQYQREAHPVFSFEEIIQQFQNWADGAKGGFGMAPKFPSIPDLEFLLDLFVLEDLEWAGNHLLKTLDSMLQGGIYDHIGGGITRYSTTRDWGVPHFEKMLYDNALLIELMANVSMSCLEREYRYEMANITDWLEREMSNGEGAYYSAMDADSAGEEGKYYVWQKAEIERVLGQNAEKFIRIYDISEQGNWQGKNIPRIKPGFSYRKSEALEKSKRKLLQYRLKTREMPGIDKKILADWNALLTAAWCRAYRATEDKRYLELAKGTISYLKQNFIQADYSVLHIHGALPIPGNLDDYAFIIRALYEWFIVTQDHQWLELGERILHRALVEFYDEEKGLFFFSSKDRKDIILRKVVWQDVPVPSGFSTISELLYIFGALTGQQVLREISGRIIEQTAVRILSHPMGHGRFLSNLLYYKYGHTEIVIIGEGYQKILRELQQRYIPALIVAATKSGDSSLGVFSNKDTVFPLTIYLCKGKTCLAPVDRLEKIEAEIPGVRCK